ncbi:Flp1 family type IVb pilin [Marinicrinis lubricantis]|uniref:Flp1 family type IVb pilin n=1 Tax=Marinicrinis lubricantis TaxID=2086470 RepID=A0ABW1IUA1_9BACL
MNAVVQKTKKLWKDEDGLGTLEILLILAVLVAIAIVFRKWIIEWVNELFGNAQDEMDKKGTEDILEPGEPRDPGTDK